MRIDRDFPFRPRKADSKPLRFSASGAMDLLKVLIHYRSLNLPEATTFGTFNLLQTIEDFFLTQVKVATDVEGDEDSCEGQKCDDEEPEEDEDCDVDDEEEEGSSDEDERMTVYGHQLHNLTHVRATVVSSSVGHPDDKVKLEFVEDGPDGCDVELMVDESGTDLLVTSIHRGASTLDLVIDGHKHVFHVSRFPREWTALLPVNETVEVGS